MSNILPKWVLDIRDKLQKEEPYCEITSTYDLVQDAWTFKKITEKRKYRTIMITNFAAQQAESIQDLENMVREAFDEKRKSK